MLQERRNYAPQANTNRIEELTIIQTAINNSWLTDRQRETLQKVVENEPVSQIAREAQKSRQSVYQLVHRGVQRAWDILENGKKPPRRSSKPVYLKPHPSVLEKLLGTETVPRIYQLYFVEGKTYQQIASMYGCSEKSVRKTFARIGIKGRPPGQASRKLK